MNIEFDVYKQKLNDCRGALDGLAESLNLQGLKNELERLQAMQEAPGFWDDPEKSQKMVVKAKQTESKIEKYEAMCASWDDLMTICEMAAEEDDDSMLDELKEGFENLTAEMESCRLHTACGRCILLSYGDIFRYLIHFSGFQDCCQEIHTLFPSTEFLFFLFTEAFFSDIIN